MYINLIIVLPALFTWLILYHVNKSVAQRLMLPVYLYYRCLIFQVCEVDLPHMTFLQIPHLLGQWLMFPVWRLYSFISQAKGKAYRFSDWFFFPFSIYNLQLQRVLFEFNFNCYAFYQFIKTVIYIIILNFLISENALSIMWFVVIFHPNMHTVILRLIWYFN